ncbi:MAG: hypothetical protein U0Q16_24990 [Bryobacteraceae bacterium]
MHRGSICSHPGRAAVEAAAATGSVCQVSRQFALPVAELYHHLTVHLPIPKPIPEDPVSDALEKLDHAAADLMGKATIPSVDPRLTARVLGLRQRQLESLVRIQAVRAKATPPDLARTGEWAELRSAILYALAPFPDALDALATHLERREGLQ